jgi:hypothetical protein
MLHIRHYGGHTRCGNFLATLNCLVRMSDKIRAMFRNASEWPVVGRSTSLLVSPPLHSCRCYIWLGPEHRRLPSPFLGFLLSFSNSLHHLVSWCYTSWATASPILNNPSQHSTALMLRRNQRLASQIVCLSLSQQLLFGQSLQHP